MTTSTMSLFFALMAMACWAGTVLSIVLALVARARPDGVAGDLYFDLRRVALWLAWLVAAVTTLGSLYYSEVAHYIPCKLCWLQRICMYPLAITLLIAAITRDRRAARLYVLPPAIIGAGIAIYHTQLQAFPNQSESFCSITEPCTVRYVWEWGFVSLPFMALTAFSFIITMIAILGRSNAEDDYVDDDLDSDLDPDEPTDDGDPEIAPPETAGTR